MDEERLPKEAKLMWDVWEGFLTQLQQQIYVVSQRERAFWFMLATRTTPALLGVPTLKWGL